MRVLLVAINAKYSHTNIAVRYLKHALEQDGIASDFAEYTINQPAHEILADIVSRRPDCLLFSCYLWNIAYVRRIGADFRLLFPNARILLGGPEVSFDPDEQLASFPWANALLCCEGETIVASAARAQPDLQIYHPHGFVDMDSLPFPYADLSALPHRVLYYESTRGCPYGCSYCLSSADRVTRRRSLPLVYADLQRFLDARVMQVKFVDRTFNLDAQRALAIWKYIAAHDNGVTSFQCEIGGDLLTEQQIAFLSTIRPGLLQFEIGVQSTCEQTLAEVARVTDIARLRENVNAIRQAGNIHQHLDLIAGLPMEDFARFAQSFDEVFSMRPQQLQLGFLKLLRGSTLYQKRAHYGLVHSEQPPYEILQTPQLSFDELSRLKIVEDMTEVYYNSGRFTHQLSYLLKHTPSPFGTFLALGERMPAHRPGKYEYYDLLFDFAVDQGCDPEILSWLMRFDLLLHERPRRLPQHCAPLLPDNRETLSRLRLPPDAYAEVFPLDVTDAAYPRTPVAIICDYSQKDFAGHAAFQKIIL